MYKISNFSDNDDVKIIDQSGPFEVIEYQRDLSVMPEDAQLAFFCSQMNVRKRQLKCELSKGCLLYTSKVAYFLFYQICSII